MGGLYFMQYVSPWPQRGGGGFEPPDSGGQAGRFGGAKTAQFCSPVLFLVQTVALPFEPGSSQAGGPIAPPQEAWAIDCPLKPA